MGKAGGDIEGPTSKFPRKKWQFHLARSSSLPMFSSIEQKQEVTDYANKNHPEGKLHVFSERFGNIGTVLWQADFEDLVALDQYQKSFDTDQGYWTLVNKSNELFIEDSVVDTVYETL